MGFNLKHSVAQRQFRKKIGQANHFLITILIGLDEVNRGNVMKPETFDVSWNPKDVKASVMRSKAFVLNSSLAWAVDNFDSYVNNCKRKPSLIEDKELSKELDSADRRVNDKFRVFFDKFKTNDDLQLYAALVALGIQWRNVTIHSDADNVLDDEYVKILLDNKAWYYNNFCHLDIEEAMKRFNTHSNPTFKETTSIIKALLRFVEIIDGKLIKALDIERYLADLFDKHFSHNYKKKKQFLNLTKNRQLLLIGNILQNNGFVYINEQNGFEVDEVFLNKYLKGF